MTKALIQLLLLLFCSSIFAQLKYAPEYTNQNIIDIVNEKEENIDIGFWSLLVAKEFNNSVDVKSYLDKLDEMANEIKRMLAAVLMHIKFYPN